MFSIVVPLYNKEHSIIKTLEGILSQTYKYYEVLIIDDGSTDKGVKKIKKEILHDIRFKLIRKINSGVSTARNEGIRNAKFEYIAFLDSDDYWEPTYLEEQAKLIRDFPDASMWGTAWHNIINNYKSFHKHDIQDDFRGIPVNYWKNEMHLFWTSAVVVRKAVFTKIGYFDERMTHGEDLDMWFRIILNYPVAFCNKPLSNYSHDSENRAMHKEIPLNRYLPSFIDKYSEYRKSNREFRIYFDKECLYRVFPYMLHVHDHKKDVLRILDQIDFSELKFSFRLRFMLPHVYNCYCKLKN